MVHFNTRYAGFSFKHTMPAVKAGCRIFSLAGMPVVPFLTGNFGANIIGHDRTIVGEVTNRKSIGFKAAGPRAENHTLRPEKMDLFFIQAETGRTGNSAVFFDEMSDDDSLKTGIFRSLMGLLKQLL